MKENRLFITLENSHPDIDLLKQSTISDLKMYNMEDFLLNINIGLTDEIPHVLFDHFMLNSICEAIQMEEGMFITRWVSHIGESETRLRTLQKLIYRYTLLTAQEHSKFEMDQVLSQLRHPPVTNVDFKEEEQTLLDKITAWDEGFVNNPLPLAPYESVYGVKYVTKPKPLPKIKKKPARPTVSEKTRLNNRKKNKAAKKARRN